MVRGERRKRQFLQPQRGRARNGERDDNLFPVAGAASPAGVRGESAGYGVLGISESIGTRGTSSTAGTVLA